MFVVCDNVRSLANVGAIFRVCDAVLVERLYLCGVTGYPGVPNDPRPPWVAERASRVIAKTAIRTHELVPWEYRADAVDVVRELKERDVQIVALERTASSIEYTSLDPQFPICIVLGHERVGVEDTILARADVIADIPMYGRGRSLNVARALGICAYELTRRRIESRGAW